MKVNIEMENLEKVVQQTMEKNMEKVIQEEVYKLVNLKITELSRDVISNIVNMRMEQFVNEYIEKATITVGGGFYSREEAKTYTVEEYIKKEIAEILNNQKLKIKKEDRYGNNDTTTVSFEEYIKKSFDASALIKTQLDTFMTDVKNQINKNVKELFDSTTKKMLSDTVLNMLMQNDTFVQLNNSIKNIADK